MSTSEAAKQRAAKKAEATKAAAAIMGKAIKLTIAKPKKKAKGPKRPHVFHIKVAINTKTGEVTLEKKAKKAKKKATDASKPSEEKAESPQTE